MQIAKINISITTIVAPTSVPEITETKSPIMVPVIEKMQEKTVTLLKLLKIIIEETEGKIINAEIKRVPTRFMARTITAATTDAKIMFTIFVFVPQV